MAIAAHLEGNVDGDVEAASVLRRVRVQVGANEQRCLARHDSHGREAVQMPAVPQAVQAEAPLQRSPFLQTSGASTYPQDLTFELIYDAKSCIIEDADFI